MSAFFFVPRLNKINEVYGQDMITVNENTWNMWRWNGVGDETQNDICFTYHYEVILE